VSCQFIVGVNEVGYISFAKVVSAGICWSVDSCSCCARGFRGRGVILGGSAVNVSMLQVEAVEVSSFRFRLDRFLCSFAVDIHGRCVDWL